MSIARQAGQTSKMKPGRAQARQNRFCPFSFSIERSKEDLTIARHASQTSKTKPGRVQARQNKFCFIFKRRLKKKLLSPRLAKTSFVILYKRSFKKN